MADNFVQILVKSRDDAKPDLDELKARLTELGHQVATARADVDDADAASKLDKLNAQLIELGKRTANPKISMSGALRAEAQIHAVEAAMSKLDHTAADGGPGWKSRAAGFAAAAASVTGLGDAMTAASPDASMFQKVMAGAGLATGLLEPVVAGATVAVGGLAAGMTSAVAGLGAFGAVAKSNLTAASTAAQQVQQAQDTYNAALKAGVKQSTAYKAEQKAIALAYMELSPAQVTLSKQIGAMQDKWQGFAASFAPLLSSLLGKVQPVLGTVFGDIRKLATAAGDAIQALLPSLNMALTGSGFQSFIKMLADNAGPAIVKLGVAIGHIATGVGGILRAFMPMSQGMLSGVDKITAAFAKWGSTLSSHSGFQSMMSTFKTETPQAVAVLKNLAVVVKNVAAAMAGLATGSNSMTLLNVLKPLSGILAKLSQNQDLVRIALYLLAAADAGKKLKNTVQGIQGAFGIFKTGASALVDLRAGFTNSEAAASAATGIWGTFGGKISTAITAVKEWGIWSKIAAAATKVWTGIQIAFDAVMDANPIALVIIGIAALIAVIVLIATKTRWFQQIWDAAWGFAKKAFDDVFGWIKGHWPLLLAILTGPIGLATLFIVNHWHQILSGAENMIHGVASWFGRLPSMILHAVGDLGHLLWNAGASILRGLLGGIESMVGSVLGFVGHIASDISGAFSSVLSIFSPSRVFEQHGKMIAAGLIQGMDGSRSLVTAAANRLAGSTMPAGYPAGAGAAAGGGGITIQFQAGAGGSGLDQLFMTWLKNSVRVQGGDPRMFNKKVSFIGG